MNEHDDNISFHRCVNINVLNYCVLSVGKALFKMVKLEHERECQRSREADNDKLTNNEGNQIIDNYRA